MPCRLHRPSALPCSQPSKVQPAAAEHQMLRQQGSFCQPHLVHLPKLWLWLVLAKAPMLLRQASWAGNHQQQAPQAWPSPLRVQHSQCTSSMRLQPLLTVRYHQQEQSARISAAVMQQPLQEASQCRGKPQARPQL